MSELETELKYMINVTGLTFEEKKDACEEIIDFLNRLFVMGDIAQDIYMTEKVGLPYYVCSLTVRSFLELQANLFQGAYHSAGRTLRWLYESNVAGATACISPSLLDERHKESTSMNLKEFENWLDQYDKREQKLKRTKIFNFFGLPSADLSKLYSDLCKYVHVSKVSFDKELDWPKLQYIEGKFDEILNLTKKTLDLVFWMESKMLLHFDGETSKALKHFLEDSESLNEYIPFTISLISSSV